MNTPSTDSQSAALRSRPGSSSPRPRRLSALACAAAGVLFAAYPAIRPYADETTPAGAMAMASGSWVIAHVAAMLGFVLLAVAVVALARHLQGTPGARLASRAGAATAAGAALVLPYYGAETFALQAIGARAVQTADPGLLELADAVRFVPTQAVMFLAGLILLAVGAALVAVAVARSGMLSRWSGVPLAVAFALFLPQFYGPPSVRIAHGLLVAAACLLLAMSVRRSD